MTIVFLNRFFYPDLSATSQILTDLAFHLASRGLSVQVITSRLFYEDPTVELAPLEVIRGVTIRRVATTRFGRKNLLGRAFDYISFYLTAGWAAWRSVRKGDVIVAKTDPPLISVIAMAVAYLRGARLLNWLQDIFPEVATALGVRAGQGLSGSVAAAIRDVSLRAAECNVVLGVRMAQRLTDNGISPDKVLIIPNWADDAAISPVAASDNPLLQEWGLVGKFVVGYSGNLGRVHEFGTVLEAASLLQSDPRIVFLFVGSGAQLETVRQEATQLGLDNILFRPYQPREQLALSLGAADLHLVTLRPEMEGLIVPSKFYGIAAAGRPVAFVGDTAGEIAGILRKHQCGSSFAIGDARGLAAYVRALADDPAEVGRLGHNARAALEVHYSQARAFQAWENMLAARFGMSYAEALPG